MKNCKHNDINNKFVKCDDCDEQIFIKKFKCTIKKCKNFSYKVVNKNNELLDYTNFKEILCKYHSKKFLKKQQEIEKWLEDNKEEFNDIVTSLILENSKNIKH
ncbi:hypothetical protein SGLAD_v1c06300 [Spiroplasma gladiatoris]|uniref:Uncharacterized protein n=1 Tax=Spiroplasma gladiatoris TaxID=2143 RepID=A0A4V1AQA6_9MOLU|nr:hypothetical protein [Spiroplasma gladiatoris]QBQ07829.1 hypothetical protein SGLAD_v1c06300 [Spiroplasma gladiatoris]